WSGCSSCWWPAAPGICGCGVGVSTELQSVAVAVPPAAPPRPATEERRAAPGGSTGHVEVMDGLRGIAIVMVVAFHYWQLSFWAIPVPGSDGRTVEFFQFAGFLGVELFFFLSAFCLFYPHAKAMFGQGKVPGLRHFYYRRAIKIVPSYLLALFVFAVFV